MFYATFVELKVDSSSFMIEHTVLCFVIGVYLQTGPGGLVPEDATIVIGLVK